MLFRFTRYLSICGLAISITMGCFLLMQQLLHQPASVKTSTPPLVTIAFQDVEFPEMRQPPPRQPRPERKPPPELPPPETTIKTAQTEQPIDDLYKLVSIEGINGVSPGLRAEIGPDTGFDGQSGHLVRTVGVLPQYPVEANIAGIEGWVKVEFTVKASGLVADVKVLSSNPTGIFEQAAIDAVSKWNFKPRYINGRPVATKATQILEFNLDND